MAHKPSASVYSRVSVPRVAVPKNIQPACTKFSWSTRLTGKYSSFGIGQRRSSNFSFCFFNTWIQSDCVCRGHGQACLDRRILLVSQTVVWIHPIFFCFWVEASSLVKRHEPKRLFRAQNCRSVFKLDYHWLYKIAQTVEAFDACEKTTRGTCSGARAHTTKHSALERLSSFQSALLFRPANTRCFMTDLIRLKGWVPRLIMLMHSVQRRNFKNARTRYEPQKRVYRDINELPREWTDTRWASNRKLKNELRRARMSSSTNYYARGTNTRLHQPRSLPSDRSHIHIRLF